MIVNAIRRANTVTLNVHPENLKTMSIVKLG